MDIEKPAYNFRLLAYSNLGLKYPPKSEKHKLAISKACKGRVVSEHTKNLMRDSATGRKASLETKEKQRKAQIGKIKSAETRLKMSLNHKGGRPSNCCIKAAIKITSIPVIQLDKYLNFIKEWSSASEASRELSKVNQQHIASCCKNKRNTSGGFRWMYKEEYDKVK